MSRLISIAKKGNKFARNFESNGNLITFCIRWDKVKFLLYRYMGILKNEDPDENLEGMLYDAFLYFK